MKDIVITQRRILREFEIFAACFLVAFGINVYAIVRFGTEWKELITTLHITLALAAVFFVVVASTRALTFYCRWLLRRGK